MDIIGSVVGRMMTHNMFLDQKTFATNPLPNQ